MEKVEEKEVFQAQWNREFDKKSSGLLKRVDKICISF